MFRWKEQRLDEWIGVDGDRWYRVNVAPGELKVSSNGTEADFRSLFRLEIDLPTLERKILASGPELAPYVVQLPGLRLLRPSSARELVFCFLCTPNNNLGRILQMVSALAKYGEPMAEVDQVELHRFPTIERIAAISESELRSKGFGYRAATIPSIAHRILEAGGEPWLVSLRETPYEQARAALMSLKGIGPKLADCMALFALHHTESVPVDTHLWQAAVRLYFPEWQEKSLTEQRYRMIGDLFRSRFGEWAGWAHQYLFYENLLNWRSRKS